MIRRARGAATALVALAFATLALAAAPELKIEPLASPVKVRLRGLSAFSDSIAWASGREGTVLRTIDGGASWSVFHVAGAETLDFRDVQAFGPDVALVMGAGPGDASRVYRTADGGRTWTLVLRNSDAEGFFDCMDFDGGEGRLLGDPVRGRFQVFRSSDDGRSWRWTRGPKAMKDEAAFAASGTCLRRVRDGTVIVTGGAAARVHFLPDEFVGNQDWAAIDVPMQVGAPSSGLFSIAIREDTQLIAVGGDYKLEGDPGVAFGFSARPSVGDYILRAQNPNRYYLNDGNGVTLRKPMFDVAWARFEFEPLKLSEGKPFGYRSAIACAPVANPVCIATGPQGTDFLLPMGRTTRQPPPYPIPDSHPPRLGEFDVLRRWEAGPSPGYDSVAIAGRIAWFSGDEGRLGRAVLPASP